MEYNQNDIKDIQDTVEFLNRELWGFDWKFDADFNELHGNDEEEDVAIIISLDKASVMFSDDVVVCVCCGPDDVPRTRLGHAKAIVEHVAW